MKKLKRRLEIVLAYVFIEGIYTSIQKVNIISNNKGKVYSFEMRQTQKLFFEFKHIEKLCFLMYLFTLIE